MHSRTLASKMSRSTVRLGVSSSSTRRALIGLPVTKG